MSRYFLRFRHSDTGLTPSFTFFKKVSDLSTQVSPPIGEVGSGTYYFDYSPTFDIVFEVDGGPSIPTEEVRYISDVISPKDIFIDRPMSEIRVDVWTDEDAYGPGQKGLRVDQLGDPTDISSANTLFGKSLLYKESVRGDSAGTSDGDDIKTARNRIMGGTGFGGTGIDIKTVKDTVGTPADTSSSSTVFGKSLLYKESIRGDSAGTGDGENIKLARDRILGGTGFGGTGVDVKTVKDTIGTPSDSSSVSTVFGKSLLYKEVVRGDSAGASDGDSVKVARDRIMGGTGYGGTGVDIKTTRDEVVSVQNTVGTPTDTSSSSTVFGKSLLYKESIRGDSAGTNDGENVKLARDRILGGTGFGGTGVDVKTVKDTVGSSSDVSSSSTLFGKSLLYKESIRGDSAGASDGNSVKQAYDRIGAPTSSSISGDIAAVQTTGNNINAKLGTPAGATVSADVAAVKADTAAVKLKTDNLPSDPASQSATNTSVTNAVTSIKGTDSRDLTELAGTGVFVPGADNLHSVKTAITALPSSATIASDVWDTALSSHIGAGSTGAKLNSTSTGVEVTNATSSIKGSGNIDSTQVFNRLGVPTTSIAGDIAAVKSTSDTINTNTATLGGQLVRALGLMHENSVLDQTTYDGSNNLTAGRLRIYNSKANALAAGATGLLNTYSIAATYSGQNVQTYTVVLE